MLVDVSKSEEEVLNSLRNSVKYSEKNFLEAHDTLSLEIRRVVEAAKIYILDNYEKVADYSDLSLMLRCGNHEGTIYIGKKTDPEVSENTSGLIRRMLQELKDSTIQVSTFNKAVYDWTDGDFSIVLNEVSYNWIDSHSIINIADYIEKNLGNEDKVL
jgi:hypothetical protein